MFSNIDQVAVSTNKIRDLFKVKLYAIREREREREKKRERETLIIY